MLEFALLAACLEHGTDHKLIRAIATQESNGVATAFYINKWEMKQFKNLSLDDAVLVANKVIEEGYTVDVGMMGINSRNVERFGLTIKEAFDPCTNINIGEQILHENISLALSNGYEGNEAIKAALSMYNTGSLKRGFRNGYVDKVWGIYSESGEIDARESDITVPWNSVVNLNEPSREKPNWVIGEYND